MGRTIKCWLKQHDYRAVTSPPGMQGMLVCANCSKIRWLS